MFIFYLLWLWLCFIWTNIKNHTVNQEVWSSYSSSNLTRLRSYVRKLRAGILVPPGVRDCLTNDPRFIDILSSGWDILTHQVGKVKWHFCFLKDFHHLFEIKNNLSFCRSTFYINQLYFAFQKMMMNIFWHFINWWLALCLWATYDNNTYNKIK